MSIYMWREGGGRTPGVNTVFYYEFDGDGTDSSGNGRDISSITGCSYDTVNGNPVIKATSELSHISLNPNYWNSNITSDFTISFWWYPKQPTRPNQYPTLFNIIKDQDAAVYAFPGPVVRCNPQNLWSYGDNVFFRMCGGSSGEQIASTTSASSLNNSRHHIAFTKRSNVMYAYIDGVLEGSKANTRDVTGADTGNIFTRQLVSPYQYDQCQPVGAMFAQCILEKVGWTDDQVADYYNQTKANYGIS